MGNINLKPRRACAEPPTNISVELEEAPGTGNPQEQRRRVAFPWMQVTDAMLEQVGFLPGQRVMLSVDHRHGKITLSLDRDYTIAGRPMTSEQIRQRGGLRID
ncbi:hypothetical protein P3T40_005605 [Paraburkholderia sp. EB58]|jgi:hypothetical protein|uniref:hypothetical protein n=1 Tax=Paraburkholderia sp. EB58 TaxID=3035125 RepID=UPI003D1E18C4